MRMLCKIGPLNDKGPIRPILSRYNIYLGGIGTE